MIRQKAVSEVKRLNYFKVTPFLLCMRSTQIITPTYVHLKPEYAKQTIHQKIVITHLH